MPKVAQSSPAIASTLINRQFEDDHGSDTPVNQVCVLHKNATLVRFHDSLADCHSQACASCLRRVERIENFRPLFLIKPRPLVRDSNLNSRARLSLNRLTVDAYLTVGWRDRECIFEDISNHLANALPVAKNVGTRRTPQNKFHSHRSPLAD